MSFFSSCKILFLSAHLGFWRGVKSPSAFVVLGTALEVGAKEKMLRFLQFFLEGEVM